MSTQRTTESHSEAPDWLVLGVIVMAGSAGYTLLAVLLWFWAN